MHVRDSWESSYCAQCGREAENTPTLMMFYCHMSLFPWSGLSSGMNMQVPGVCVWTDCPSLPLGSRYRDNCWKHSLIAFLLEMWFLISFPPAHWPDFAGLSVTSFSCPIKPHFWSRMCICAWLLTSTKLLNIPSCKHMFNWLLFELVFLFICT